MMSNTGFKLIAIRPLKGCPEKYLKNLKEGMIYTFYDGYDFYVDGVDVQITSENYESYSTLPLIKCERREGFKHVDLYSIKDEMIPNKSLNINVSAVVGKNGSGKSSLIELYYRWIYEMSFGLQISLESRRNNLNTSLNKIDNEINDLLYKYNGDLNQFHIEGDINEHIQYKELVENKIEINEELEGIDDLNRENEDDKSNVRNFLEVVIWMNEEVKIIHTASNKDELFSFYNIATNYSLYGLNSNITGKWIEKIFHKNDGYSTPLVLNPMRTEGNIDINNENHLNKTRLLLNLGVSDSINKRITKVIFKKKHNLRGINILDNVDVNRSSFQKVVYNPDYDIIRRIDSTYNWIGNAHVIGFGGDDPNSFFDINPFIEKIFERFYKDRFVPNPESEGNNLLILLHIYLMDKVYKYAEFNGYLSKPLSSLLQIIKDDHSHKTFKIFQIIHLIHPINFNRFIDDSTNLDVEGGKEIVREIDADKFNKYINYSEFKFINDIPRREIYKVPAAYFELDFKYEKEGSFGTLSSGELQFLNSINTVLYHVRNIESLNEKYKAINIIFDEIELYYHPDYQRHYISKLLNAIENLKLEHVKNINIQFLTHSPFILSDIPLQNILKLKDGKPEPDKNGKNSFAANIHDLLNDEFFLENGTMGAFAESKIKELIHFYHRVSLLDFESDIEKKKQDGKKLLKDYENKKAVFEFLVNNVGEPVYQSVLTSNLNVIRTKLESIKKELGQ